VMCAALKVTLTCCNNNNADAGDGRWIRAGCRGRKCNGVGRVLAGRVVVSGGRDEGLVVLSALS